TQHPIQQQPESALRNKPINPIPYAHTYPVNLNLAKKKKSFPAGKEPMGIERHRRKPVRVSFREKANQSKCRLGHVPQHLRLTKYRTRSRRESNPHLRFRKPPFYPLNYGNSDNCDPFDSLCSLRTSF